MTGFPSLPQVQQKVSEVEVREKELFDWRKKVSEVECKLTQQENLLECAVKERNLSSRNLLEAQVQLLPLCLTCNESLLTVLFAEWCFFLSTLAIVPVLSGGDFGN